MFMHTLQTVLFVVMHTLQTVLFVVMHTLQTVLFVDKSNVNLIGLILQIIIKEGNLDYPALTVSVLSNNLPFGAGLGSSAAYSVALVTAFMLYAKQLHTEDTFG